MCMDVAGGDKRHAHYATQLQPRDLRRWVAMYPGRLLPSMRGRSLVKALRESLGFTPVLCLVWTEAKLRITNLRKVSLIRHGSEPSLVFLQGVGKMDGR
jgi:hypothetical protein